MAILLNTIMTICQQFEGCSFASVDTLTPVPLKLGKKNPMQGRVSKRVEGAQIALFKRGGEDGAYQRMVERRLEKEGIKGKFELSPRTWGERDAVMPIVRHVPKGETIEKHYLEVIYIKPPVRVQYLLDGLPIDKADIVGLDDDKAEGAQGGLTDKVIIRTYNLDNVTAIRAVGQEFTA